MHDANATQLTAGGDLLTKYLNVRLAYFPSFSPDGQQLAFVSDITGVPQAWQVDVAPAEISWPDQLTFGHDRVMGVWHSPAPGERRLIYARDKGGNENAQLFLLHPETGEETLLTPGFDHAMHTFGEWSAAGDRILFSANRRAPGLFDLYVQDLVPGAPPSEAKLVWQNNQPGFIQTMSFSPDEARAIVTLTPSSFQNSIIEVDLHAGTSRVISPDQESRYDEAIYAPDGRSLYLLTDYESDFLYVARLHLDSGQIERLANDDWDAELLAMSPDGRYLAYVLNIDGVSTLRLLDLASGDRRTARIPPEPPGVIGFTDGRIIFSHDATRVAFAYMSATRTSDVYVCDVSSGDVFPVTHSSHGGLPASAFVSPELVRYPTFDSEGDGPRQIPAWYFKPPNAPKGPVPAVVIVHGGPEAQFRPYFNWFAQYLLSQGYAVLAPNVRGSTGYGKAYAHLDDVRKRMDSVADLAHAANWLAGQPEIDPDKLVVYGGSYGGFMVLSSLTTYPDLWAAGVDVVGISNFVTFLENTSEYRRAHREAEYGSLSADREFLHDISPLTHIDRIAAPLLLIHGTNDPRVPVGETRQILSALEERGVPAELLLFEDEGHGIVKLKNKQVAYPA
ncbi:MAG: alpha/beta fold hydrolase, partial [Chloroflexia bacterium]